MVRTLCRWSRVLHCYESDCLCRNLSTSERFNSNEIGLILAISLTNSVIDAMDRVAFSSIALFVTSSIWQFQVHSILASLRPSSTKSVYLAPPQSSLSFRLFLTPHYTAEILMYLAMSLVAKNWTMFTALIWVVTNLSVSAGETREWAHVKFDGKEWGQWNLIPFIY